MHLQAHHQTLGCTQDLGAASGSATMPKPDVSTPLEQGLEFALVEQDAGPIAALSQGLEHMAGEMTRHVANWTLQQADHFGLTQHRPLQGLLDMCRQQSIRQERSSQRRRPHNSSLMPRWTPVLAVSVESAIKVVCACSVAPAM